MSRKLSKSDLRAQAIIARDAIQAVLDVPDEYWDAIPDIIMSMWTEAFKRGYAQEKSGEYKFSTRK